MKNRLAARRTSLCAAFLVLLSVTVFSATAGAQAPANPPVPPAYGVAQRLQSEAAAARSAGQPQIAHNRAYQAVKQLQQVVSSRMYGKTEYARKALREQAGLEENYLRDKNAAVQSLQTLHNTFPDDPAVEQEITRLGNELDQWNKTFAPPPAPPLHNLGAAAYHVIDFLVALTGRQTWSYWVAILLISVIVKLALTPLSNKQYRSMKEMQKLQPYIQELQAKHKNDKEVLGRKMMDLYKEHGINPAAGCTPLLFQLPILYLLYYTIQRYQYQFSHGEFLWIGSGLSHQFPTYLGINLGQPDIPLLLLYAASMYVTQKMTITPTMDPQQAETQKMMAIMTPFMTTYFFLQYHLPSAFVLYYLTFNILSTAQQKYYMRKRAGDTDLPPPPPSNGSSGGSVKAIPLSGNVNGNGANGNGSHSSNHSNGVHSNGAAPTAKGLIAPTKIHPKKKRR